MSTAGKSEQDPTDAALASLVAKAEQHGRLLALIDVAQAHLAMSAQKFALWLSAELGKVKP